ncbi:hypothetical protein CA54_35410 [Symmachiella macrocystis]|uniref:Uncharacterized protein n=1 Tax=Symmachiella macrocystis TaxID=2527985 RepID=A0A5C6BSG8_9PLAN|nr:hypothetical protein [Symmachiella macrocystis]TWU14672.1 hypothetical protein CA54_35410 [Symmachiella macrocystis]
MNSIRFVFLVGAFTCCAMCVGGWIAIQPDVSKRDQLRTVSESPEDRLKSILAEKLLTPTFVGTFCVIEADTVNKTEKHAQKTIQFNGKNSDTRRIGPPTSQDCLAYLKTRILPAEWKVILSEGIEYGMPLQEEIDPLLDEDIALANFEEGEWVALLDSDGNDLNGEPLSPDDPMSSLIDSMNSIPTFPEEDPIIFGCVGLARPYEYALRFFSSRVVALPGGRLQWELTPKPKHKSWIGKTTIVVDENRREVESATIARLGSDIHHVCKVLSIKRSRDGKDIGVVMPVTGPVTKND